MTKIILKKHKAIQRISSCVDKGNIEINKVRAIINLNERNEVNNNFNTWNLNNRLQLETIFSDFYPLNQYDQVSTAILLATVLRPASLENIKEVYIDCYCRKIQSLENVKVNINDGLYSQDSSLLGTHVPAFFKKWGIFIFIPILLSIIVFLVANWENVVKIYSIVVKLLLKK